MTNPTEETVADDTATDSKVSHASNGSEEASEKVEVDGVDEFDASMDGAEPASQATDSEVAEVEISDSDESGTEVPANEVKATEDSPSAESAETETSDGDEAVVAEPERVKSPYDRPGRWYVLHTQSGYENKVKTNLEARTQSMNMESRIFEVVIPLEDVVEFKNGKKVVVQKKVFPGYLLTRLHLDDDSWFVVRNTPGVTGFAGAGNAPVPMRRSEVEQHLGVKDEAEEAGKKGRPRLEYGMGETVRVKEGPFADFQGEIVEINEDQLKVKVLVNIFGRETPVELEFAQVGKV